MQRIGFVRLWVVGLLWLCQTVSAQQDPYQGWQQQLSQGQQIFTPTDPQYAAAVTVKFYPVLSLPQGTTPQAWFEQKLQASQPPSGDWLAEPTLHNERGYVFYGERLFQGADGERYALKALAISLDQRTVRLGSVVIAQRQAVIQAYSAKAEQLLAEILKQEEQTLSQQAQATVADQPYTNIWQETVLSNGQVLFTPKQTEFVGRVQVKYYPMVPFKVFIDDWLKSKLTDSSAPDNGQWQGEPKISKMTRNMAQGSRTYRSGSGVEMTLNVFAVSVDGTYVRLAAMQIENEPLVKRYYEGAGGKLISRLFEVEKAAAQQDGRGLDIELGVSNVAGVKKGGELKPGRYIGNYINSDTNEVIRRYELHLYPDDSYEWSRYNESGYYSYSPLTGRMDINSKCRNGTNSLCVYGTDDQQRPIVFVKQKDYQRIYVARLFWAGDLSGQSPAEKDAAAQKEREERAAWAKEVARARQTLPNQGLTLAQIEAVTYDYRSEMNSDGYYEDESKFYLLLKDGSYYDTPALIAPADLNVAASKKMEPAHWGQWQKRDGGYYNKDGQSLGHAVPAADGKPVSASLKHSTYWGSGFGSVGSSSKYLILNDDGTFEKERSSYALGGSDSHSVNVSSHADKNGQSSAAYGSANSNLGGSTSSVVTRSRSESKGLSKDKYGTYTLTGYTLELRYADGDVTRSFFFFTNQERKNAYFNGVDY